MQMMQQQQLQQQQAMQQQQQQHAEQMQILRDQMAAQQETIATLLQRTASVPAKEPTQYDQQKIFLEFDKLEKSAEG